MFGFKISFTEGGKRKRTDTIFRTRKNANKFLKRVSNVSKGKGLNLRVVKATKKEYEKFVKDPYGELI
tara:strand:+ start:1482 stop:1685 length:204 start_codon:yes stop_codon:yes gene_type:complete